MEKKILFSLLDENEKTLQDIALDLWNHPEVAFEEVRSSKLQRDYLAAQGFTIRDVPNNPTSFIAEFGSGHPIIGISGEYDALPKLSQKVCSHPEPAVDKEAPGHGCGHNLLGTAGMGAVVALKTCMERESLPGTIRYYGCAAEEALAGKPLMAREGVFDDLDACISWHPSFMNILWGCDFMAMNSMKFRFKGTPSHAAIAPEAGRSALDAVELMNVGANYLREHVIDAVRLHYTITNGGGLPNTVPADAEVWYYIRAPKRRDVRDTAARLIKVAQGAAMMTETTMSYELLAGCYDVLPNHAIGDAMCRNMKEAGPPTFGEAEYAYAKEFAVQLSPAAKRSTMDSYFAPEEVAEMELCGKVLDNIDYGKLIRGSTDVGDISYIAPFAQLTAACWPVGFASHTWVATACTGSTIGLKAMLFAAKSMAGTAYDLLTDAGLLDTAQAEFRKATGGEKYVSPFDE